MSDIIGKFNLYLITEKCVSTNTLLAYTRDLDQFMEFCKKYHCDPSTITVELIKVFFKEMFDRGLSTASRARKISVIKSFMIYSFEEHAIIPHLVPPTIEKRLPSYLSEKEMKLFMKTAAKARGIYALRNKLILYLLYATGMRVSELTSLKMSNIDLKNRLVKVDGKGSKQRLLPLIESIIPLMHDYYKKYHSQFNCNKKPNMWLFPIKYHGKTAPITRQNVMVVIKNLFKRTGIQKNISPHSIRHTFATHMINRGSNIRLLQLLLGHEHITTTEIYTHVDMSKTRKIYNKKHPRAWIVLILFINNSDHVIQQSIESVRLPIQKVLYKQPKI